MELWTSAEGHQPAYSAVRRAQIHVEPYLNTAFASSSLASLECKLRYVPIIMPEGMRERYPARSTLRKSERVYDCSPQLNYETFVDGSFEDQLREYVGGLAETSPQLAKLGASKEQIEDFNRILSNAVGRILAETPAETRH